MKYRNKRQRLTPEDYKEMVRLREEEKWTFEAIGELFNIAKWYASTVVKKYGGKDE